MQQIPIPSEASAFSLTVSLDGEVFLLSFVWNTRCLSWSVTIAEQDGTILLSGIKILPTVSPDFRHKDTRLPKGAIVVVDATAEGTNTRPLRSELSNQRVQLWYLTEEEVNGFISA